MDPDSIHIVGTRQYFLLSVFLSATAVRLGELDMRSRSQNKTSVARTVRQTVKMGTAIYPHAEKILIWTDLSIPDLC